MANRSIPELQLITYSEFARLSFELVGLIQAQHSAEPFDVIVCINRGGAVLARILSDYLDIEVTAFGLVSYDGINQQKAIKVNQELNADLAGKKVLLVDEICDTGKTFLKAIEIAERLEPKLLITATLITKPHTTYTPNYSVLSSDKWVVFPYEVRETLKSLGHFYATDPGLRTKLQTYFAANGISSQNLASIVEGLELS